MTVEKPIEKMTLEEIRTEAEKHVAAEVWTWVNGGTETGFTLERNCSALEKILLRLKVLHGLDRADTTVTVLGQTVRTPVVVAPFANTVRLHPEAELGLARGAREAGAMMFLGPVSAYPAEEITKATTAPVAWNGDPLRDREKLAAQIREAERAGCCAVGLCVDDFMGVKINDLLRPLANRALSPEEVRALRKETSLPFFLKGIMTKEDALAAADAGVDAIVVSNHGGRVLDCCQASIEVLPEIVKAVGGKIEVLVDGGFRRGTDILKALALGAKAVLVGRPMCWGLAAAGERGVGRVLSMMTEELARAMVLANVADLTSPPRECLAEA